MGVDMRVSFQVAAKPGEWVSVPNEFRGDRSYSLFAWLGAPPKRDSFNCNTIVPVHKLRGLPKDISPDEEELYGEHSYSWLTSEEILSAAWPDGSEDNDDPDNVFIEFINVVKHLHAEHGDVRIVFGFEG
ncbi:TPA: hypothetical protein ACIWEQ_003355 [Salmonella enterica subsp. enterica serovar Saintpaul]